MSAFGTKAALSAGIEKLSAEAAGLLSVAVVQLEDLPNLVIDMMRGDPEAGILFTAVRNAISAIDNAPRRSPALCVSCPRVLRKGRFALCIAFPDKHDPAHALGLAVCRHCATDADGIKAKAVVGLKRLWPNLRPINITHKSGGHA